MAGLLIDENGERLVPPYANKSGRRYRYDVSASLKEKSAEREAGWRLPAPTIERVVLNEICRLFRDKNRLIEVSGAAQSDPSRLESLLSCAARLSDRLHSFERPDQRAFHQELVKRIELRHDRVRIILERYQLQTLLAVGRERPGERLDSEFVLEIPINFKRRGVEMKLVMASGEAPTPDPFVLDLVAQARGWLNQLRTGDVRSARHLARRVGVDPGDLSCILPLAFLAPDIIEAILDGNQSIDLTATRRKRLPQLPLAWSEQRELLGFT